MSRDPLTDQSFPTRRQAARVARMLGCVGAHEGEDGWLPCESEEALDTLVNHGIRAYRRRYGSKSAKPEQSPQRTKKAKTPGVKTIISKVEDEFGQLRTFNDFNQAFTEAFPNAKIGVDDDLTPKQIGGSYGLLFRAMQDDETASLVGFLTTGEPNAGIALSAPLRAPLGIVIGDGDSEEEGVVEALHMWGHLAGLAASYSDIDQSVVEQVQTWVNEGGQLPDIPGLTDPTSLIGTDAGSSDASQLMLSFGLDGTEGRIDAGMRAIAARIAVGRALIERTRERTGDMDEEELADILAAFEVDPDGSAASVEHSDELELRLR